MSILDWTVLSGYGFAMFQGRLMQRVSRLEGVFCHANVVLSVVPMLYSGFVYDVAL